MILFRVILAGFLLAVLGHWLDWIWVTRVGAVVIAVTLFGVGLWVTVVGPPVVPVPSPGQVQGSQPED